MKTLFSGGYAQVLVRDNVAYKLGYISKQEVASLKRLPRGLAPRYIDHSFDLNKWDYCSLTQRKMYKGKLLMEYIQGVTLQKCESYCKEEMARLILAQAERMHNQGIAHRDLHGNNILVGQNGNVYFIDFGASVSSWYQAFQEAIYFIQCFRGEDVILPDFSVPWPLRGALPNLPPTEELIEKDLPLEKQVKYLYRNLWSKYAN